MSFSLLSHLYTLISSSENAGPECMHACIFKARKKEAVSQGVEVGGVREDLEEEYMPSNWRWV